MARRIVISGASGLIGSALVSSLRADGVEATTLVRRPPRSEHETQWAPGESALDPEVLDGAEAVVALGGASVGRLPWTKGYRRELIDSRLQATRTLTTALRALRTDAPALVSASAVGYYGSAPGEVLTEESAAGRRSSPT
ncbi:NAD-dependent epimerase/dehydratase family protein [Microbacterium sp. Se5.02b]|uniref:NAD-dependent epimerase/dehydratase family protein n=1 Tax=Microbacterium sp. Se63.02b TaxID=2709304 RepID=UPI002867CBD5|nr:NAD-dependent epimerase/dehydratase family protein [Microbacterium sp. Se5.02b]